MSTLAASETGPDNERQAARAVVMIEPAHFAANPETRATNRFQSAAASPRSIAADARRELDGLAEALDAAGVRVHGFAGNASETLPDEVFPNNWFSTHADGTVVTYPMAAPSRRRERRADVVEALDAGYAVARRLDLSAHESEGAFLEGTGSLVLDRAERVAYACRSARTAPELVARFGFELGYATERFTATDPDGHAIYHTNVALSIGTCFAVVAAEAIGDAHERSRVLARIEAGRREIIEIDFVQLAAFAGNLLELEGGSGPVIALSRCALESLDMRKRRSLERYGELVVADIATIERFGGGSVRCMLAEIHLAERPRGVSSGA